MKPRKSRKNCGSLPWRLLKRYLANCSIHGVRYLVQEDCHWSERVFWFVCCGLSWWGCSIMVSGVVTDYSNRPVATTLETNYLQWRANFPSLHFCPQEVPESKNYVTKTWPKFTSAYKLLSTWGHVPSLNEPHDSKVFETYTNLTAINCELMFDRCLWNEKKYNCCEIILPVHTPIGNCLVFNSIHSTTGREGTKFTSGSSDRSVLTIFIKSGSYFKVVKKHLTLYVLDRLDLPSILSSSQKKVSAKWINYETQIDVIQEPTYNEDGVRKISVDKRNCRFADETENLRIYKSYGYDACLAENMLMRMLDYCGCVTHIVHRHEDMPVCNFTGLSCITRKTSELTNTDNVKCANDCDEITFDFFENFLRNSPTPIINVNLLPGPTMRYRRYIVHSKLDIVVSVGSAIGLFVGASILSIVEIPYWFIVRGIDDEDEEDDDLPRHD